jgi:hypothetical protein
MVQELRQVILGKEEFISALESHSRMNVSFLPKGKIVAFEILDMSTVMITVATDENAEGVRVIMKESKLLKPLIRFCLENNIMLPRDGHKSVLLTENNVTLCIALEVDTMMAMPQGGLHFATQQETLRAIA